MIGLERALVRAQDDVDRSVGPAQRGEADPAGAVDRNGHRTGELDLLEDPRLAPEERRRGLSHRLEPDDGREQRDSVERVLGEVRVDRRRELGFDHELDARVVEQRAFEESQQRKVAALELHRRRPAEAAGRDHGGRESPGAHELFQQRDAVVHADCVHARARECVDRPEPLAHPDARPDGPLDVDDAAAWRTRGELLQEPAEPLVRECVVRLAAEADRADDRAEADDEPQRVLVHRR